MRTGVVVSGCEALGRVAPLGLQLGERKGELFFDAHDARAVRAPTMLRRLARVGTVTIGAALVDGRIVAALEVPSVQADVVPCGVLLADRHRGETVLLMGVGVVGVGSFEAVSGDGTVEHDGRTIPIVHVGKLLDELERLTWEVRRTTRMPDSAGLAAPPGPSDDGRATS